MNAQQYAMEACRAMSFDFSTEAATQGHVAALRRFCAAKRLADHALANDETDLPPFDSGPTVRAADRLASAVREADRHHSGTREDGSLFVRIDRKQWQEIVAANFAYLALFAPEAAA